MKKIIILILLLVSGFCGYGQMNISVDDNTPLTNTPFSINMNLTGNRAGCKQRIVVTFSNNNLEFIQAGSLPSGAVPNSSGSTITIDNIVNNSGGSSENVSIIVKFARGSCNGLQTLVTATASFYECDNPETLPPVTINLTAHTTNELTTSIWAYSSETCVGKIVRYQLGRYNRNTDNTGFDAYNLKSYIQIPPCAEFLGATTSSNYEPQSSTYNSTTGEIVVSHDNLTIGNWNLMDIYVKYPCNTPTCLGNQTISYYIKATSCDIEYVSPASTVTSEVINTCTTNYCLPGGTPGISVTTYVSDTEFRCPGVNTCDEKTETISHNINIPHQYLIQSQGLVFSTKIPDGVEIFDSMMSEVNSNYTVPCPAVVEFYYSGSWHTITPTINGNSYTWTNPGPHHVSEIKYTFNCAIYAPSSFNIYQNYKWRDILPALAVDDILEFPVKIVSGTTVLYSTYGSNAYQVKIKECKGLFYSYMYARAALSQNFYDSSISAVPGDKVTYRMIINNYGNSNGPITIQYLLDEHLTYAKNVKYAIYPNYIFESLPDDQNVFPVNPDPIVGTATIMVAEQGNREKLEISGFNIPEPCPYAQSFIVEFDVIVKSGLNQGAIIPNNFIATEDNVNYPSNTVSLIIGVKQKITSKMYARCSSESTWSETGINGKNGETIVYKMVATNEGTVPLKISELLNLKPQNGDFFETDSQASRGSSLKVNYDCGLMPPTVYTTTRITPILTYSQQGFDMNRNMICPPGPAGQAPVFGPDCNVSANWFRIEFPGGYEMAPGESVSVEYYGKVSGSSGTANNSFVFKLLNCSLNSDVSNIVSVVNDGNTCMVPTPCEDCASFDLIKLENYLVSAWVKESDPKNPLVQYQNFEQAYISIAFKDDTDVLIDEELQFFASGEIIDGWQRIIGQFRVPATAYDMFLKLANNSNTMAYFDDIRVMPSKSNMKSFVYDQKTQRLMAELDENNYSTFYEYDLEGGLIRIKKETEKGIFTIQETRSSNKK